jgi:hypothetical protein
MIISSLGFIIELFFKLYRHYHVHYSFSTTLFACQSYANFSNTILSWHYRNYELYMRSLMFHC